jgi:hypothetical protein
MDASHIEASGIGAVLVSDEGLESLLRVPTVSVGGAVLVVRGGAALRARRAGETS